jgi:C1A family cysteine protease
MPSRLFIYYCARSLMGTIQQDSGVDNRSLLKALARYGWCDEADWPYDIERFRTQPLATCFEAAAKRKIVQYLAVPQTLDQMKGCLAGNDPFIFGFTVYESLESEAVTKTGVVPMPGLLERATGGHDVTVVGYDDTTQRFKFKNSWGPKWGINGYGWIPYSYATNPRLAGDFWTVRHAAMPSPSPAPTPAPIAGRRVIVVTGGTVEIDGKLV